MCKSSNVYMAIYVQLYVPWSQDIFFLQNYKNMIKIQPLPKKLKNNNYKSYKYEVKFIIR